MLIIFLSWCVRLSSTDKVSQQKTQWQYICMHFCSWPGIVGRRLLWEFILSRSAPWDEQTVLATQVHTCNHNWTTRTTPTPVSRGWKKQCWVIIQFLLKFLFVFWEIAVGKRIHILSRSILYGNETALAIHTGAHLHKCPTRIVAGRCHWDYINGPTMKHKDTEP